MSLTGEWRRRTRAKTSERGREGGRAGSRARGVRKILHMHNHGSIVSLIINYRLMPPTEAGPHGREPRQRPSHRYNTRNPARLAEMAANSHEAQDTFLAAVGMMRDDVEPLEEILTTQECELIACALQHKRRKHHVLLDPYFIDSEWERALLEGKLEEDVPFCDCMAHQCMDEEFYMHVLSDLTAIQSPVDDSSGSLLAQILTTFILKKAQLKSTNWQMGRGGGLAAVHYILRLPSGVKYRYKGYPDFIVSHRFSQAERHLGLQGREEKVKGVGKVQLQRGSSVAVKNRALAQAGIYTICHFVNTKQITGLATLILYKDLTVHVALATINLAPLPLITLSVDCCQCNMHGEVFIEDEGCKSSNLLGVHEMAYSVDACLCQGSVLHRNRGPSLQLHLTYPSH